MKTLEQIQEENRKIIILANNPTAKTYDEALKMELGAGCQFESYTSPFAPKHKQKAISTILWDDGLDSVGNGRFYCYRDDHTYTVIKRDCKIIGKPLTLNRILIAINKTDFRPNIHLTNNITDNKIIISCIDHLRRIDVEIDLNKETAEEQDEIAQRNLNEILNK